MKKTKMIYYYIIGALIFAIAVHFILKEKPTNQDVYIGDNVQKDSPVDFGYKINWIAVKTNNKEKLLEILNFKKVATVNWESGIKAAYSDDVFITPQIGEWTLIVGSGLPHGDTVESMEALEVILNKLSSEFENAQFFGTHRVVEYHNWMKSTNGKIERIFNYIGERGETIKVVGEPTIAEKEYNFFNSLSEEAKLDSYWDREDLDYPNEEIVMKIAGLWSVDPTKLSERTDIKVELGILLK